MCDVYEHVFSVFGILIKICLLRARFQQLEGLDQKTTEFWHLIQYVYTVNRYLHKYYIIYIYTHGIYTICILLIEANQIQIGFPQSTTCQCSLGLALASWDHRKPVGPVAQEFPQTLKRIRDVNSFIDAFFVNTINRYIRYSVFVIRYKHKYTNSERSLQCSRVFNATFPSSNATSKTRQKRVVIWHSDGFLPICSPLQNSLAHNFNFLNPGKCFRRLSFQQQISTLKDLQPLGQVLRRLRLAQDQRLQSLRQRWGAFQTLPGTRRKGQVL